jgi:hypothetical protein
LATPQGSERQDPIQSTILTGKKTAQRWLWCALPSFDVPSPKLWQVPDVIAFLA